MKKNLNRRSFSFLNKKRIIYIFFLLFFIIVIIFSYIKKNYFENLLYHSIENISKNLDYQYTNLKLNGLERVDKIFFENILDQYSDTSIFLLPLEKISHDIRENNWVKNVKLTTNYKDTLFVDLEEYKAIGIYNFNNKLFYFDLFGKIIDQKNENNHKDNLILFFGQSSNLEAKKILEILEYFNFQIKFDIKKIIYIEKRRWDLIINKNIRLMLSESSPKKSLENFIKIQNNLSETDFNNINYVDLRDLNKTLITFNND